MAHTEVFACDSCGAQQTLTQEESLTPDGWYALYTGTEEWDFCRDSCLLLYLSNKKHEANTKEHD